MPLIDLKSELSLKRQVTSIGNSAYAVAESHVDRLVELLTSSKGLEFAAKQAILDPTTATQRLGAILQQVALNPLNVVNGGKGIQSVFPTPARAAKAEEESGQSIETKYYVKSPITREFLIRGDYEQLRDLDIVPFYFTILETERGEVVPKYHLAFQSFFSTISDNTTGNYASYNFIGRGENFHTYQNYTRTLTLTFKVAAFKREELNLIHNKVDALRRLAAPKYRQGYMQGNFVNLTVGNYMEQMPGFITSVNATISENFNWEIEDRSYIMPHMLDISVTYTVLESTTPQLPYRELQDQLAVPKKQIPRLDIAQGAPQLAAITSPPPTPQDFTADFSTPGYSFQDNLFDI